MVKLCVGGQNPYWDGPVVAAALSARGHQVRWDLHSADDFSRDPSRKGNSPAITREHYVLSGGFNRWTACIEHPTFLGRSSVPSGVFERAGVDFGRIASFRGGTQEGVIANLTGGDWYGITLGEEQRLAHGMPTRALTRLVNTLGRQVSSELSELMPLGHCSDLKALEGFFTIGVPTVGPAGGRLWEDVGLDVAKRFLDRFGAQDVSLTTSYGFATAGGRLYSPAFAAFVSNYRVALELYNEAVTQTEENVIPLSYGELPFFALMRVNGVLKRFSVEYRTGDSADQIVERMKGYASEGGQTKEFVTIIGKAVMFALELRATTAVGVVEGGSPYMPAVRFFAREARTRLPTFPRMHPGYTIRLNALDALGDVQGSIGLPPYLAKAFGGKTIACADLARLWRSYADTADSRVQAFSGPDPLKLRDFLRQSCVTDGVIDGMIDPLIQMHTTFENKRREIFISETDKGERTARKNALDRVYHVDFLAGMHRQIIAGLDLLRAEALKESWCTAQALRYWNRRPFASWIAAFPGWMEAVKKRVECVPE